MKYLLSFLVLILTISTSSCQELKDEKGKDDNVVPEAVIITFQKKYPNEKVPEFKTDAHGYWEGHFKEKGEKYRADFYADGTWIETENSIKYSALPKVIREKIKVKYALFEISEVEHVMNAKKGEFYDVEFKQKGKNMDIEFRKDGTIIEQ